MEFSDALLRLLVAAGLGGLVGLEREYRDKSAGFRTQILIALGSSLFTIIALELASDIAIASDPGRIIGYIVAGIGFLGAGAIMKDNFTVKGLTTSSTIWLGAGIGIAAGAGYFAIGTAATAIALFALIALPEVENWIDHRKKDHRYVITITSKQTLDEVLSHFKASKLKIIDYRRSMRDDKYILRIMTFGKPSIHRRIEEYLLENEDVTDF
ncbi:MAG: MgtC/SapB family protein [bacterium]|nr:MgtC/SapB family protein [bacterium]